MVAGQMRLYDEIAFGIERDGTDGGPVASVARPARRVEFASPAVQGVSGSQNCVIVPGMALSRTDVTNAAVTMINVAPQEDLLRGVPMHKAGRPGAGLVEVGKALGGELGPVLDRKSVV